MQWHLLNQLYVNIRLPKYEISILEDLVSSELQLVSLLMSGSVSRQTMISTSLGFQVSNQIGEKRLV